MANSNQNLQSFKIVNISELETNLRKMNSSHVKCRAKNATNLDTAYISNGEIRLLLMEINKQINEKWT